MKYLRWLLFPFSLVYALVVAIRNWCYDTGIFKSIEFKLPVIAIGNLDVGGAGKSPMTEYLIRLFKDSNNLAVLSRGYGRKTKGFVIAGTSSGVTEIGDEPAQFKSKFPNITVAVCENRVIGITLLKDNNSIILLDDAYQHRAVKPGYSILLLEYNKINEPRLLLPAGNMREAFSGLKRADTIIISKCPAELDDAEIARIKKRINPYPHQQIFYTAIEYLPLKKLNDANGQYAINENTTVFLLTGIANPVPLVTHLKTKTQHIIHHKYPDHHQFSLKNISKLAHGFLACASQNKLIITTEKDAQRLGEQELLPQVNKLPFLVLPIGICFLNNGQHQFDELINNYVKQY